MSGPGYSPLDFDEELNDLKLGIEKEKKCIEFYRRSAEEVADERVKTLCEWMAIAGETRITELQALYAESSMSSKWADDLKEQLEQADIPAESAPSCEVEENGSPGQVEIITIRQAIEMEKEAASIYHTAVRRSRDKNVRELWRYLAASEEGHKQLLDTYFDVLMQVLINSKKKRKRKK